MKNIILLLAIAGLACGLQAPLQYKYKYFGSISTGIPELSNQASGWAMKAEVEVFVEKDDGYAIFKLSNVKTIEFNENIGCDFRGEIPDDHFTHIKDKDLSYAIEAPFRANLVDSHDFSIEFHEDKYRWLVNLRKGIVSIFRNAGLRGNVDKPTTNVIEAKIREGHIINVIDLEEETIFGKCFVQYAGHPLPAHLAARKDFELRKHYEYDIQTDVPESAAYTKTSKSPKKYTSKSSKKTSTKTSAPEKYRLADGPNLKDQLFHSVKTVDFDKCQEMVGFQINSVDYKDLSGGQVDWRKGRSSVTEYIFRGTGGASRLESAIVEGATTYAPFGFKTEFLQARTNQTLQLIGVTKDGPVPEVSTPLQHSNTWMYEVWSFAEPPKYSKPHPWVVYTGEGDAIKRFQTFGVDYVTPEENVATKKTIIENIKVASLKLTDLDQEDEGENKKSPAKLMKMTSYLFKFLSKEDALEIFAVFFTKDLHQSDIIARKLVIDAAAASGHHHAIDAVMVYIKDGKIPDLQIMTFFMNLASNSQCPSSIPNILDWVLTLDVHEKPFLTSTVSINLAHLIHEMCISPRASDVNYAGKVFGDHGCKKQLIKDRFQPFIMNMLKDDKEWVNIIGIKVLTALHVPSVVSSLAPIIEGKVKCSIKLRVYAIQALEFWGLQDYMYLRKPITDLLTDVYSDVGENVAVREAALYNAATWSPDASFYQTLARISWREPSRRFASFISSLIRTTAESIHPLTIKLSQAASHAVKFTKPVVPSPFLSNMIWVVPRDENRHIVNIYGASIQISKSLSDLIDITTFMMYDFGGLTTLVVEAQSIFDLGGLEKKIVATFVEKVKSDPISAKVAKDFYDQVEETIKSKFVASDKKDSFDLYLLFINHIHIFLPFNEETFEKLPISDATSLGAFMLQLSMGYDLVLGKYFNPVDYTAVHPTDIGLPLFISGSSPIVITDVSYSSFATGSKRPGLEALKKSELSIESLIRFSSMYSTSMGVLLPWDQKLVKAGVSSKREITLPFKKTLRGDERHDGGHQHIAHFDIQSIYKNKFTVMKAGNKPYTSIGPILPVGGKYEKVYITRSEPKETLIPVPNKYTGLDLQLSLKSEAALPFTFFNPEELLNMQHAGAPWLFYSFASPTAKYWYTKLEYDPLKSSSKNISFEFMTGTFGKDEKESISQQTGEEQYGYEQYDQEQQQSFNPTQEFQEVGGNPEVEILGHINYGDSLQQRSQKMQNVFGGAVKISSFKVNFDGDEHRSYEILFSFTKAKVSDSRKVKKIQVSLVRSPIPYVDSKPASVCIDIQKSFRKISELDVVEMLLKENLDKEVKAEVTLGCTGDPVFVAKGSFHISDDWKDKYLNHLQEYCDADPIDPLYTFKQHAVYDDVKVTYTWEKVCDPEHFPLMTRLFKIGRHLVSNKLVSNKCGAGDAARKIEVDMHRCPVTGNWYVDIQRDDFKVSYKNLPHGDEHNFLFGVADKEFEFYPEHYSSFGDESDKCIVGANKVRTFDGLTFDFAPTNCWTVAAKTCLTNDKMLLVRASQDESNIPEAKFVDVSKGLVIEYINHALRVNGKVISPVDKEEIKSEDGKVLAKIYKKSGYGYLVKFDDDHYMSFKDTIELHLDFPIHPCGMCGNNDGEPENDLVGPQRCFYHDTNLFTNIWTVESDKCDVYSLVELREQAEKFQSSDKCKKIDDLYETCPYFNHRCISYGYKIREEDGDNVCVTSSAVPYCEESCDIKQYATTQLTFNCWPADYAPDILKTAAATKQKFIQEPMSYEPYFEIHEFVSLPTICKQF